MTRTTTISLALVILSGTALALAQPERTGQPGRRGGDPAQFVDRMIQQRDANKDGKLSRDELPERLADRIFESGDTNGDGAIDREELLAAMSRNTGPGQRPDEGPGGAHVGFEASMKNVERALRGLKRSPFSSESMPRDIQIVQVLQQSLFGAKSGLKDSPWSDRAKEHFDSNDARLRAMRFAFLGALRESLALETAILEGKEGEAAAVIERLEQIEEKGHEMFQPVEP